LLRILEQLDNDRFLCKISDDAMGYRTTRQQIRVELTAIFGPDTPLTMVSINYPDIFQVSHTAIIKFNQGMDEYATMFRLQCL
jgi:hypothetical protein